MNDIVVFNISKIQFKSNSQLDEIGINPAKKLCSIFQRYNLKAIHNYLQFQLLMEIVVFNISKIQFKSNSQPLAGNKSQL